MMGVLGVHNNEGNEDADFDGVIVTNRDVDFDAFINEVDNEMFFEEDPEFCKADWEDSTKSDDDLHTDVAPEVQQNDLNDEIIEEARVRSNNKGEPS